jgi:hypothetical protein
MFSTSRNIMSVGIVALSGFALWHLPDHVRGDNQLFGANGTLLPALALAIICGLAALETLRAVISVRRQNASSGTPSDDVQFGKASVAGILIVTILAGLFAVSLRTVGYFPAATVLVLALMFGTGGRNLGANLLISIAAVALLYVGIRYGLGAHLQVWPDFTNGAG